MKVKAYQWFRKCVVLYLCTHIEPRRAKCFTRIISVQLKMCGVPHGTALHLVSHGRERKASYRKDSVLGMRRGRMRTVFSLHVVTIL